MGQLTVGSNPTPSAIPSLRSIVPLRPPAEPAPFSCASAVTPTARWWRFIDRPLKLALTSHIMATIRPTAAFVAASWLALLAGALVYLLGLWNAEMQLNEKGYYFTILMYGLFASVSLQKSVRDKMEGTPVTQMYYSLCWVSMFLCVALLAIGLWNSGLQASEKGFYGMSYILALFGSVTVQKNVRDLAAADLKFPPPAPGQ